MGRNTFTRRSLTFLKERIGCIVCPTKVGYIIMTSDKAEAERKFEAKSNRNKVCRSFAVWLTMPTGVNQKSKPSTKNIGMKISCLVVSLPWRERCLCKITSLRRWTRRTRDERGTLFVIKFGKAGEQIAKEMWEEGKMGCLFSQSFR